MPAAGPLGPGGIGDHRQTGLETVATDETDVIVMAGRQRTLELDLPDAIAPLRT